MVWDGRCVMHVQRSVKSVRRKAKPTHSIERVENVSVFWTAQNAKIWSLRYGRFSRWPCALFASLGTAAFSRTHCSRCRLHGIVAAFTLCLLFRFAPGSYSFLPCSHHNFLPFWRRDNETATAATVLRMINLRNCTQLFCKQDVLIAFLSGTNVCCAQATPSIAFLKRDKLHS